MAVGRFPLLADWGEREPAGGTDSRLKNCWVEVEKKFTQEGPVEVPLVVKRPGLKAYDDTASVAEGRGVFYWNGSIWSVVADKVYKDGSAIAGTLNTSTGRVYFDTAADGSGLLVFQDGSDIYTVNTSDTLTTLSDPQIPSAMSPGIAVLDQYCFVMDTDGAIHNSDVGDVTAWSGNTVIPEVSADGGVGIIKYLNYLIALNEQTFEIFYDAANASGSPLSRYEGSAAQVGCPAGSTATRVGQDVFFVGVDEQGGRYVAKTKGFALGRISTTTVDEYLDKEGSNISDAYAFQIRKSGKSLYVLTLPTTASKTFVYDTALGLWYEWSSDVSGTETYWTPVGSANISGTVVLLDEDNGKLYSLDSETYQDNTGSAEDIQVQIDTPKFDMNTKQKKFLWRLNTVGDLTTTSADVTISWSDDDYQNFSTGRTLDISAEDQWLSRCGSYVRRSFRLTFTANQPLRLEALEGEQTQGKYAR